MSEADFQSLYNRLHDGTDWGPADRRGALNNITAAQILSAAGLVQAGITVSLQVYQLSRQVGSFAGTVLDWCGVGRLPEFHAS